MSSVLTIWCILSTPRAITGGGRGPGSVAGMLACAGCWGYGWVLGVPALVIGAPSGDDMGGSDESRVAGDGEVQWGRPEVY